LAAVPTERLSHALIIASIERAGDHAAVFAVLVVVVAIGGLIYGVVRLAAKSRAGRTRPESDRSPDA
jgi:hypothetical protein